MSVALPDHKLGWRQRGMLFRLSRAIIKPRRERQRRWLERANQWPIRLQVQGGVAYDKDLRDLVARGLLVMGRVEYADGWVRDVRHPYQLSYSVLRITEAGLRSLEDSPGK